MREWLSKDNSGVLLFLSEYLMCGVLVCAIPGGVWKYGTFGTFIGNAVVCAAIAGVCVLTVKYLLGDSPTNGARLKAVAVEIVLAYALYAII